jgi:hypothetical protein
MEEDIKLGIKFGGAHSTLGDALRMAPSVRSKQSNPVGQRSGHEKDAYTLPSNIDEADR